MIIGGIIYTTPVINHWSCLPQKCILKSSQQSVSSRPLSNSQGGKDMDKQTTQRSTSELMAYEDNTLNY